MRPYDFALERVRARERVQPVARPAARITERPAESARVNPSRSAASANSAAPALRHQSVSVRPSIYRHLAPIALHLQGESGRAGLQDIDTPQNPCSGGQYSGPDQRGRNCLTKDPG